MAKNLTNSPVAPRRGLPLWEKILFAVFIVFGIALYLVVGVGIFRAQHPIMSIGSKVPDFTLKLFDGYSFQGANQVNLASLRGKVVVVNFWASWCVTCADESPVMEAAWNYYQPNDQVVFLGVDYTDVDSKALQFLSKFNITYPNGPDLGTRITPIFNSNIAMPETYIVDQQGILRSEQIGPYQSLAQIRSAVDPLINGK